MTTETQLAGIYFYIYIKYEVLVTKQSYSLKTYVHTGCM